MILFEPMNLKASIDDLAKASSRTRTAFFWTRIFRTPFWAIYTILPFIILKELHATPFQIGVYIALKPVVSLLSLYWSAWINKRKDRLRGNLIWANFLGLVPFFFFPYVNNPWYIIAASGIFMALHRGVTPAWMEILKLNLPGTSRQRVFAWGSAWGYIGDGIFPFIIGWLLDDFSQSWRWLFPLTAVVALLPIIFQYRIPIHIDSKIETSPIGWSKQLIEPWKNAWELIRSRDDFLRFQIGFMLGGSGLMLMQAVLPQFFMEGLKLSYTELAMALTFCKGVGFASTSQLWARWMNKMDIYRFSSWVTLLAFVFPFALLGAQFNLLWLYGAYLIYGTMQAGSELSWNLSGPIFAKEEDSSLYSSVNVLSVGIRGCFAPTLGSCLLYFASPMTVLILGGVFCLMATQRMHAYSRRTIEIDAQAIKPLST